MPVARVPLRRSLVLRLLATSLAIAVSAIAATAWLTFRSTDRAIRREQGQALSASTRTYDELLGYAATHPDWSGAGPLVTRLGRDLRQRVTLTGADGTPLADSAPGAPLAVAPTATVDPLHVDGSLTGRDGTGIDPRAAGPYRLPAVEADRLRALAGQVRDCLTGLDLTARVVVAPSGRPRVQVDNADPKGGAVLCTRTELILPTPTEEPLLTALATATSACLGVPGVVQTIEPTTFTALVEGEKKPARTAVDSCLLQSRRDQLEPYVAPAARLYLTSLDTGGPGPAVNLSRSNLVRIFGVTGLVLAAAIVVTVLVGSRLVRPLRALAEAAYHPDARPHRVPVSTRDEIGRLAIAFNALADRREQLEGQRQAMVSDVAHELRSPLTNIRSWLEGAQDGLVPLEPELLDLLLAEAVLLQHIIDDLRDLAAADAGSLRLHPEPAYVNDVLAQAVDAHREAAKTAEVRLEHAPRGDPQVVVDPQRLRQLLGNLLTNAIRHTPPAGTVTLRSAADHERLEITVADTGEGIAPDDLPRVFDRFWRADSSRSRETGGSGLGLSIVRRLVEAHGGTVTVASRPGAGTTFTVRLPIHPAE
ncbi:sensor histidine kinase [Actinoplanes sp. RD1]|uniref:sensor histidine kinase n=1 Tax=Actinoplanes sp. RD1 TaxID=3064538 RepID=UPI002741996D|nr:HAMP domain-containing sensor histidine kinase [Actinoplanes sp. RD1]